MKRTLLALSIVSVMLLGGIAYAQDEEGGAPPAEGAPPTEGAPAAPAPAPTPEAAPAPAPAAPAGDMYIGFDVGPAFMVKPSGGGVNFWFGPEFGTKWIAIPLLLSYKDSMFGINLVPSFKYDISLMPNLTLTPSIGLDFGFATGSDVKTMGLGIGIAARGTYMFTPAIGAFIQPVELGLDFWHWASVAGNSASNTEFTVSYRLLLGGVYKF